MRHPILIQKSALILFSVMLIVASQGAIALNANHNCNFCHSTHSAPGQQLLNNTVVETLCMSCHGPGGSATRKAEVHKNVAEGSAYAPFNMTCIDCHDPHDSVDNWLAGTNIMMVGEDKLGPADPDPKLARISTPSSGIREVVFESRGTGAAQPSLYSFADDDEDNNTVYDGVCEVCHTETKYHRNTGDPVHSGHANTGKTCTSCHPHGSSFLPPDGPPTSGCENCHNIAQGTRRVVMDDFGYFSHHLQGSTDLAGDCLVCHDLTNHSAGNVELLDIDGGATITLTGDPDTSSTEAAKLTDFCLNCHDQGDPTPFSDGVTVPYVDPADWAANAAHNANSCYGDGSTFGCHGNAHGSQKKTLLAPWDTAPTGPDFSSEEEGLCFNCHDSGGPAADDIATLFTSSSKHPVVNSDHSGTGRDLECTTCHNQHNAETQSRTVGNLASGMISDVDGINAAGSPVSTITYEYELCFKCHSDYAGAGNNIGDGGPDPVANKRAEFDTSNGTFHPVMGVQDNADWDPSFMEPPFDAAGGHHTMWCSDCHQDPTVKGPHGSDNPSMLRAGLSAIDSGDGWYTPLCVVCHKYASYVTGSDGRFGNHDTSSHFQPDWSGGYGGCLSCHFGADTRIGSIHGGNFTFNAGADTVANESFLNGNRIVLIAQGRRDPECTVVSGGDSDCGGHTKSY